MIISSECPRQLARSQSVPSSLYRHDYLKEELAVGRQDQGQRSNALWAYFNYDNDAHAPKRDDPSADASPFLRQRRVCWNLPIS
jgi:hypothetical protein